MASDRTRGPSNGGEDAIFLPFVLYYRHISLSIPTPLGCVCSDASLRQATDGEKPPPGFGMRGRCIR